MLKDPKDEGFSQHMEDLSPQTFLTTKSLPKGKQLVTLRRQVPLEVRTMLF